MLEQSGQIQANITELDILDGHVRINVEQSIIGDVSLLMGGLKSFEPYMMNYDNCTFKVPNGNLLCYYRMKRNYDFFSRPSKAMDQQRFAFRPMSKQDCIGRKRKRHGLRCDAILD